MTPDRSRLTNSAINQGSLETTTQRKDEVVARSAVVRVLPQPKHSGMVSISLLPLVFIFVQSLLRLLLLCWEN